MFLSPSLSASPRPSFNPVRITHPLIGGILLVCLVFAAMVFPSRTALAASTLGTTFTQDNLSFAVIKDSTSGTETGSVACTGFAISSDTSTSVRIPATATSNGITYTVTTIWTMAFYNHPTLTSVDFSAASNLTTIMAGAFASCGLTYNATTPLVLPASLTTIAGANNVLGAFQHDTGIERVDFEDATNLTIIGQQAFADCGLNYPTVLGGDQFLLPPALVTIGKGAFQGNAKLSYLNLMNCPNLVTIEENAFRACAISSGDVASPWWYLAIPPRVQKIGTGAFASNPNIYWVDFSHAWSLRYIMDSAFALCAIISTETTPTVLTIPPNVQYIGPQAFGGNYVEYLTTKNLVLSRCEKVIFTGATPPATVLTNAFLSTGGRQGEQDYKVNNIKHLLAAPSSYTGYSALASALGASVCSAFQGSSVCLINASGVSEYTFAQGAATDTPLTISLENTADGSRAYAGGTIGMLATLVDSSGVAQAGTDSIIFIGKNESQAGFVLKGETVNKLQPGAYELHLHPAPMTAGTDQMPDLDFVTIYVSGTPTVSGSSDVRRPACRNLAYSPTVQLSSSYPEDLTLTCSVVDNVTRTTHLTTTAVAHGDGSVSFLFSGTDMASLPLGSYLLVVSSAGSARNAAIANTTVGSIEIDSASPTITGPVELSRSWGDTSDLTATVHMSNAWEESIAVAGYLQKAHVNATREVKANGDISLTFDGQSLSQVDPGTYSLVVYTFASKHNVGTGPVSVGYVTIDRLTPSVAGSFSQVRRVGSSDDLTVDATLSGSANKGLDLQCSIISGTTTVATASTHAASDGAVSFDFAGSGLQGLAAGTYSVVVSTSKTTYEEAIDGASVGTLTVAQYVPAVSGDTTAFRAVGTNADLTADIDLDGSYAGDQTTLDCTLYLVGDDGERTASLSTSTVATADGTYSETFGGLDMSQLPLGTYDMVVSAAATEHDTAISPTSVGTVVVHASDPNVKGATTQSRHYADTDDLLVRAMLTGIYEGEDVEVTCDIDDAAGTSQATDTITASTQGVISAGFTSSVMQALEPGDYTIVMASPGSANNAAFGPTQVGTVSVSKNQPAATVSLDETRRYGDAEPLTITGGVSGVTPGETVPLTFGLIQVDKPWNGTVLIKTVDASTTSSLSVTFGADEVKGLEPGCYTLVVSSPADAHNKAIESSQHGTLVVDRYTATVTGSNTLERTCGSTGDLTVTAQVTGTSPNESLTYLCEVVDANGTVATHAALAQTGDGNLSFTFPEKDVTSLDPGTYTLVVSSQGATYTNPIGDTQVGTLVMDKAIPTLTGATAIARSVGSEEGFSATCDLTIYPEDYDLTYSLVTDDGTASTILSGTVSASASGPVSFTFDGGDMVGLEAGSYLLVVTGAESTHNTALAPTTAATLTISKLTPVVTGSADTSVTVGMVEGMSCSVNVTSGYLGSAVGATLTVESAGMVLSTQLTDTGEASFTFDEAANHLPAGTYVLLLDVDGTEGSDPVSDLMVGQLVITDPTYAFVTYGDTHERSSGTPLILRVETNRSYATAVLVDGVKLDSGQASIIEGSTVVTLDPTFLDTLSTGTHTLTVEYSIPVSVNAKFTLTDAPLPVAPGGGSSSQPGSTVPNTSDGSADATVGWLLALGAATLLIARRMKSCVGINGDSPSL